MTAMVAHSVNHEDQRELAIGDAHLIAAAPDLYGALEQMLDECEDDEFAPHVMDARSALAKARGEQS